MYESQLGGADEAQRCEVLLQSLAEKDPAYFGPVLSTNMPTVKTAANGAIKDIKFLDTETCFSQIAQQQAVQYGTNSGTTIPFLG